MTPLERRCRALLQAWPASDRRDRGGELIGTLLDVIPDGRAWPPILLSINLVWSGLVVRARRHPRPWPWLKYRFTGKLDPQWLPWLVDDLLEPRAFRRRQLYPGFGFIVAVIVASLAWSLGRGMPFNIGPTMLWSFTPAAIRGLSDARSERYRNQAIGRNWDVLQHTVVADGRWEWTHLSPPINVPLAAVFMTVGLPFLVLDLALWRIHIGPDSTVVIAAIYLVTMGLVLSCIQARRAVCPPAPPSSLDTSRRAIGLAVLVVLLWTLASGVPGSSSVTLDGYLGMGLAVFALGLILAIVGLIRRRAVGLWDLLPPSWLRQDAWVWVVHSSPRAASAAGAPTIAT